MMLPMSGTTPKIKNVDFLIRELGQAFRIAVVDIANMRKGYLGDVMQERFEKFRMARHDFFKHKITCQLALRTHRLYSP